MEASIRPALVPSLVVGVALALAPLTSPAAPPPQAPPVVLATVSLPSFINQELTFNVQFVEDFVTTGAQLFAHELPIPITLLTNIRSGVPVLTAVGRALQDLIGTELVAGRALVAFGSDYVNFQIRLVSTLFSAAPAPKPGVKTAAALSTHHQLHTNPITTVPSVHQAADSRHSIGLHKQGAGSNLSRRPAHR
ncbi:MAG: hypothetical protein WCE30_09660 [Mycobacterium sp.]